LIQRRKARLTPYEYMYTAEISEDYKDTCTDYYFENDGELTPVKSKKFARVMAEYFSDDPSLS